MRPFWLLTAVFIACGGPAGASDDTLPDVGSDSPTALDTSDVPPEAIEILPEAAETEPTETEPTETEPAEVTPDAPADAGPPVAPALALTVDAVPAAMNGSEPFLDNDLHEQPFHVAVPRQGFTLDVTVAPGNQVVDPATLRVTCDAPVGDLPAGADLGPRFTWQDATRARWLVDLDFPVGWPVTVSARVTDGVGLASAEVALAFEVAELTPDLDPFETPNLWLLDFRRDAWSIAVVESAAGFEVVSTPEPLGNGAGDFDERLRALGFLGPDPAFDAAFLARFRAELRANLRAMFGVAPD